MRFFYRELGNPEARTIFIAHGWLGLSEHWLKFGEYLADSGFHVIIPDLPNHGRSFHTDMFSYDSMARFLYDFLSNHSFGKPILIGHSMGGKIIMKMADFYPQEYQCVIVVDILPKSYPELCQRGSIADVIKQTKPELFRYRKDLLEHFRQFVSDKGWLALLMQNVENEHNVLKWRSNAPVLAEYMNEVAGSVELHKSSVPALLIRGDRSEFTPMEDLDLFTSFYERSEIVTITNASHWVFVDRPAVFMKEIANYLERYSDL